jgi:hypothetical protein
MNFLSSFRQTVSGVAKDVCSSEKLNCLFLLLGWFTEEGNKTLFAFPRYR